MAKHFSLRYKVFFVLESGAKGNPLVSFFESFIISLILLNVATFVLETVPEYDEKYGSFFELFDIMSISIFTLEYFLRVWACVEYPVYANMPHWKARMHFVTRGLMLIDFIAVAPFYLGGILGFDLRSMRILRLLKFFKIARYSPALTSFVNVFYNERKVLASAGIIVFALWMIASTGMYVIERDAQPENFGSIPKAGWWALVTLTTVGYGDVTPITENGKLFASLILVFGYGMFALPIGIIATAFAQEINRREFVVTWGMVARVPIFRDLLAVELSEIMKILHSRTYMAGNLISPKGEEPEGLFFITNGEIFIESENPITLGEGDFFGEMALIEKRPRKYDIIALSEVSCLVLDKDHFETILHNKPVIAERIAETIARRKMENNNEVYE